MAQERVSFGPLPNGISDTLGDELDGRFFALRDGVNESLPQPRPWNGVTQFLAGDAATHQGQLWRAKRANVNVAPIEGDDWTLLVARGAQGPAGPSGNLARTLVTITPTTVRVSDLGKTFLAGCDFSALGQFADACYTPRLSCDEPKVIILESHNQKSPAKCFFTIYVPSDAPVGTLGDAQDLQLSLSLAGWGWTGAAASGAGAWDALAMVL